MTHRDCFRKGFLTRLLEDRGGNTLAIAAAATLPLMALIGGGVDISRAYMTKTQLQSACDAGVLAGRRAMSKTGSYGDNERAKADAMFNFNFDGKAVEASDIVFQTDDNDEGQVTGTASATMPTAVMKIFGKDTVDLEVGCMAELQLANVDVMFVMDVTGSMGGSKIQGLRDAVRDFHATIATAVDDAETRVRYGFVPYSTTVNASELISSGDMPTSYFADTSPYQTKVAIFDNKQYIVDTTTSSSSTSNDSTYSSKSACNNKNDETYTSGTAPSAVTTTEYSWKWQSSKCKKTTKITTETYKTVYKFSKWRYKQADINTSSFKGFSSVKLASSASTSNSYLSSPAELTMEELGNMSGLSGVSTFNSTWNGCLEERDTVQTDDFDPVPEDAFDLDLNLEPDSDQTRWKPIWRDVAYYRSPGVTEANSGSSPGSPCPAPMKLFTKIDLSGSGTDVPAWLDTYLDNLVATGNTYHDIGMIWGGRLGSPQGIFADNVNEDDEISVSRNLIFMTDGKMEPKRTVYTAYGTEISDNRVGPVDADDSELADLHTLRFRAACDAIKGEGYTIYVIGFGTTVTDDLKYCASSDRWYFASDTTELRNTFKFIASQVADLRLGQ